jgi:hypothetical protein
VPTTPRITGRARGRSGRPATPNNPQRANSFLGGYVKLPPPAWSHALALWVDYCWRDERLALMFACAHPAIDPGIRAPLILQTVLGFDAATVASAFLISPATMGQRLVRAKAKIRQAAIPFRVPERAELRDRLDAVLAAIYAAFAEGWSDPAGTEIRRRNLAEEGIWLGRLASTILGRRIEDRSAAGRCSRARQFRSQMSKPTRSSG